MEYVLIGVGGTGARILEAFTFLSAAGVLGEKIPKVHMRMIEMDTDNGNLERLEKVLDCYSKCYDPVFSYVRDWQARKIIPSGSAPFVWQIGVQGNAATLSEKFNQGTENKNLLHGLYGSEDLALPLEEGCKGRPRIGALEYAKRFQDDITTQSTNSFWNNLFSGELGTAQGTGDLRIMFVGSMFGGSGASGVPNIAKLVKEGLCSGKGNKVGLTLMSPFYSFNDTKVLDKKGAESKKFMINSKTALMYYDQSDILDKIHSMYVVGAPVKEMCMSNDAAANNSTGSKSQCNPAMPALLVAALSALDFFINADDNNSGQVVVAETIGSEVNNWNSYPYSGELQKGIMKLQRLSLLWRLIKNKINADDLGDWGVLYQRYGKYKHFIPETFLNETSAIRDFFLGQDVRTENSEPWNIGAEGFLLELEKNGMKGPEGKEGAVDISDVIQAIDLVNFTDRDDVGLNIAGVQLRDLHDKINRSARINVGALRGDVEKRARFIAGVTKASLPPQAAGRH